MRTMFEAQWRRQMRRSRIGLPGARGRGKILFFAAEEVRRRNAELGALLTTEQGKPIREAVDEVNGFANILEITMPSRGERGSPWFSRAMAISLSRGARSAYVVRSFLEHAGDHHGLEDRAALVAGTP